VETQYNISLKYQLDREAMIRFQLMVHCHMNGLMVMREKKKNSYMHKVSFADIDCMTLIGMKGPSDLLEICKELVSYGVFATVGSVRNAVYRLEEKKLLCKKWGEKGSGRKIVSLNPDLKIGTQGGTLLEIKCYAPQEA